MNEISSATRSKSFWVSEFILPGVALKILIEVPQFKGSLLSATEEILSKEPLGVDCVFECCGQQEALDQAFDILKPGGQLVIVGIPRQDTINFSADKFRRKEITIKYIRRQNHCVQKAINFIKTGKIDINFLITHRFKLEQTQNAFELLTDYRDGVIKAMINM